jgi:hypothetical protein
MDLSRLFCEPLIRKRSVQIEIKIAHFRSKLQEIAVIVKNLF